jgi:site-specific recombinase XerD
MTTTLALSTTHHNLAPLAVDQERMIAFKQKAGAYMRSTKFSEFRSLKAERTTRSHDNDLRLFAKCMADGRVISADDIEEYSAALATSAAAWQGVTGDVVAGFRAWLLGNGYAQASIGHALATLRVYAGLAHGAGILADGDYASIRGVGGWSGREAMRKDDERKHEGFETRIGRKRTAAQMHNTEVTSTQLRILKHFPDPTTPQGRRDRVMLALLIDFGLRVGELEILPVNKTPLDLGNGDVRWIGVDAGLVSYYAEKTHVVVTLKQTPDVAAALRAWFDAGDAPAMGALLRASRKGGALSHAGMTRTAIAQRVRELSQAALGMELSPHDLRHASTTELVRRHPDRLDDISATRGWKPGSRMIYTYAKERQIANADGLDGSI